MKKTALPTNEIRRRSWEMGLAKAIFCIAAILSLLAAIAVFLITYEEYKHHYPDKRKVLKTALEPAVFTLIFVSVQAILAKEPAVFINDGVGIPSK